LSTETQQGVAFGEELRIAARPGELALARKYAEDAAVEFGLHADACQDFALAANEAVTNAIRHGEPDEHGHIRLRASFRGECLTLTVQDQGTFKFPIAARPDADHGRGLAIMASLMDEVVLTIGRAGTTVRLCKQRQ